METLGLEASLEHLSLNGYQKAIEDRQSDLLVLQNMSFFPVPSHPPPSFRIRTESVSSLDSVSVSSSFSPTSSSFSPTSPSQLSQSEQIQSQARSSDIMPSPLRLKPSEVLQVGLGGGPQPSQPVAAPAATWDESIIMNVLSV